MRCHSSPVVRRAGCNQQCNRLREILQPSHDAVIRVYDDAAKFQEFIIPAGPRRPALIPNKSCFRFTWNASPEGARQR
jgi:hypothetical protein